MPGERIVNLIVIFRVSYQSDVRQEGIKEAAHEGNDALTLPGF